MDNMYMNFQDIADHTGKSYRTVRDRLMKLPGAPTPVRFGRDTFLRHEVMDFLASRPTLKQTG